ncbi:MAG TPA: hypothetical protein QGF58_20790 [Myxococcota bacterium]|nr:hypothetical protein [Myxococcota bacterium]
MIARETWVWAWPSVYTETDGARIFDAPDCQDTWFGKRIELDEEPADLDDALQI